MTKSLKRKFRDTENISFLYEASVYQLFEKFLFLS